jgi:hypothetical protein
MPHPLHALDRAMGELTLGVVKSTRKRDQRDWEMGFKELQQQFQIKINGQASEAWGFAQTTIVFDYPFFYAPAQRDSDLDRPQFWFGAELYDFPGAASAVVTAWEIDPTHGAVVGATVSIGVASQPGVDAPYEGVIHLTFQGFAALSEDETAVEE